MHTATIRKTRAHQTAEAIAGRALDFLYGDDRKTERTLGLAFLAMALGIVLQSMAGSAACAI